MSSSARVRSIPLAFPKTMVEAGQKKPIEIRPYLSFRGQFLAVKASIAQHFSIDDLIIGNYRCTGNNEPIPAEFFAVEGGLAKLKETAFHQFSRWDMVTATPANVIRMTVINNSDKPLVFEAALFGLAIES